MHYLVVSGPNPDGIVTTIRRRLRTYTHEEIAALVRTIRTVEDFVTAIRLVAISSNRNPDPVGLRLLTEGLSHENVEVRRAALQVSPLVSWAELRPFVAGIAATDPDESLRTLGSQLLARI